MYGVFSVVWTVSFFFFCFLFFFQAEDGIRDHCVTGVQTCALPISSIEYLNNHWVRESLSTDAIFSSDIDLHLIVVFLSPSSEINTTKRIGWCRSPALKLYVNISSTPHSKLSSHSQILWHNVHVRLLHSGACWCCKCVPYFCENHVDCQSKT